MGLQFVGAYVLKIYVIPLFFKNFVSVAAPTSSYIDPPLALNPGINLENTKQCCDLNYGGQVPP